MTFAHPAQHLALEEMLGRIERAEALCERLKQAIQALVGQWSLAPVVEAIQALRGVSLITAAVIVAEVGSVKSRPNATPFSRPIPTPFGVRNSVSGGAYPRSA